MSRALAVFGGSGSTGQQVVRAAVRAGWRVSGLVRRAGSLDPAGNRDANLSEMVGAVSSASAVDRTLERCSAACILLGPRPPYTEVFCAAATAVILDGMRRAGIRRVICQTGAMIGSYPDNRSRVFQRLTRSYQRKQPEAHRDRVRQEELVRSSGLSWTLVKPPRLTDGVGRGPVVAGPAVKVGLLSAVSRADLADFIVDEVRDPRFVESVLFVRG